MQKLEDLLTAFAAVARADILRDHTVASCVASTWITIEVMRYFQVPVRPITVKVEICNAAFADFERQHGRRPFLGESDETYIMGIGFQEGPGYVGTHIVALADERIIVDASIDQGNAPEHGIELPGVVWIRIDTLFLSGHRFVCDIARQRLIYIPDNVQIDLASLYDFRHNPETDSAVQRIIAELEARGFRPFD